MTGGRRERRNATHERADGQKSYDRWAKPSSRPASPPGVPAASMVKRGLPPASWVSPISPSATASSRTVNVDPEGERERGEEREGERGSPNGFLHHSL